MVIRFLFHHCTLSLASIRCLEDKGGKNQESVRELGLCGTPPGAVDGCFITCGPNGF